MEESPSVNNDNPEPPSAIQTSAVVKLTEANVDEELFKNDAPEFEKTGTALREKFPSQPIAIAASVNCPEESQLESRFEISKYPTIKLSLFGKLLSNEYRGRRDVDDLVKFVEDRLKDPTILLSTVDDWGKLQANMPTIIAHIQHPNGVCQEAYKKAAIWLKGQCKFYVSLNGMYLPGRGDTSKDFIYFKGEDEDLKDVSKVLETEFKGNNTDPNEIYEWAKTRCKPTVSELTFENAEELAEPGLPFLVLFRDPKDYKSLQLFKAAVKRELTEPTQSVRALVADGNIFHHPLAKVGKSTKDLPVILLDSFVHMYTFKRFSKIKVPGKLKQFIKDLGSGMLHLRYHDVDFGFNEQEDSEEDLDVEDDEVNPVQEFLGPILTDVPESAFKSLQPSKHRYTMKREEL